VEYLGLSHVQLQGFLVTHLYRFDRFKVCIFRDARVVSQY